MNYVIGTGYYDNKKTSEGFFQTWMNNTKRFSSPSDIVVVNSASSSLERFGGTWINMKHNYGHVKTMSPDEKYGGWWLGFMTSAMIAYGHGMDFIYKEQDCLAFGAWVQKLFDDSEYQKASVIVGKFKHKYQIEQSLVLVRRKHILSLIGMYLSIPESDKALRPELKFLQLMNRKPGMMAYTDMGCGRNRPIPYASKCFYAQQLTPVELKGLASAGLI